MTGGALTNRPAQPIALLLGKFKELQKELSFSLRQGAVGGFEVSSQHAPFDSRPLVLIQQLLLP